MDLQTQVIFILRTLQQYKIQMDNTALTTAANVEAIAGLGEFVTQVEENEAVLNEWRDDIRNQFDYLLRAQEQTDKKLKLLTEDYAQLKTLVADIKRKLDSAPQNQGGL